MKHLFSSIPSSFFGMLLAVLIYLTPAAGSGQTTKIRGIVTDSKTGEPLPFVNISFTGTTIGTITDLSGGYFLETRKPTDSIVVSFVGYTPKVIGIKKNVFQTLDIPLEENNISIAEVTVNAGENPAFRIMDSLLANKDRNTLRDVDSYQFEIYNKVEIDVNNINEEFRNNKALKNFQFIFDYLDTSAATGKAFLPIFISETLSDYYARNDPKGHREVIRANKLSGVDNSSISQFTGQLYLDFSIYDNNITIFEQPFTSPLSAFGRVFYKYYLIDSMFIDQQWCYQISFQPKRRQEFTFSGDFWVNDSTWAVTRSKFRMSPDVNINFINDLVLESDFEHINDQYWFPVRKKMFLDFNLTDRSTGFFGTKTTYYRNFVLGELADHSIFKEKTDIIVAPDASAKPDSFWTQNRHEKLSAQEEGIYKMVDSIRNVPVFKTFVDIITTFVTGYYVMGLFEAGPYFSFFSFNEVEGNRIRLGGRTSNTFSKRLMFDGHMALSTRDETGRGRFKYGLGAIYILNKNPRQALRVHWKDDVEQLGKSQNAFTDDNILASLLTRNPNYKLTRVRTLTSYYEKEWFTGFSNTVHFTYNRLFPTDSIPLHSENLARSLPDITTSEIRLNTRFAFREKYMYGEFERNTLGSIWPILNLNLTFGIKGLFEGDYNYFKADFNIEHILNMGAFGYLKYTLDGGKIFSRLPYPLLRLHEGNETYAFDEFAFNMMNYYEFVSDEYLSLFGEHHFMGFFLNRIPVMRALKLREVVQGRALFGRLTDQNLPGNDPDQIAFPRTLGPLTHPYFEVGFGIENIFKILRLDAVYRMSYLDKPEATRLGLRAKLQIVF